MLELKNIELLTIIFTLLNIIFLTISLLFYHEDHSILNKYKDNWLQKPIIDITEDCDLNNTTPLISSKLYGHSTYCNCSQEKTIYKNNCSKDKSYCESYDELKESNITKFLGKQLCAIRANDNYKYFITNPNFHKNSSLNIGIVDTNGLIYSFYNNSFNHIIPITDLKILKKENASLDLYNNYTKINLNENYVLLYGKNITNNKSIIVNVELSINEEICAYPNEGEFSMNNFEFNKKKGNSNCEKKLLDKKNDDSYTKIFSYSAEKLLQENNIQKYDYLNISNKTINLFSTNYIGIEYKCYEELSVERIFEENISFSTMKIFIILMILYYIIFIILILKRIKRVIDDIVGFLFINIVTQLMIGLFCYSSIAPFLLYKGKNCITGIYHEIFNECFYYIQIAFYLYSIGFSGNFINMIIVYCLENPDVDIHTEDLMSNDSSSKE